MEKRELKDEERKERGHKETHKRTEIAPVKKKRSRAERRKARRENAEREWDELARETNLLKKLKKGKITEEEFEHGLFIK